MERSLQTILLIDDSFTKFIDGFSTVGKTFGFTIQPFYNPKAGIAYLQENKDNIGAVLLDLSFTSGNYEGVEALQQIKNSNTLLPVIMLAGSQSEKDMAMAVACMKEGAFNYVVKTNFDLVSLFQMVKVAVSRYQSNAKTERHTALKEEYRSKYAAYQKMLYTTEMILQNILKDKLMFPPTFEGRVKEFKSFYEKVKQKEAKEGFITEPFKRVTDIAGLRVVFYNSADMQKAMELLTATNDFINVDAEGELKGDDKSKTYGYRAVHFDVKLNDKKRLHLEEYHMLKNIPCEVQFKTIFAHSWSKVYHALSYKEVGEMKLTQKEKEKLDNDFKEAAKNLESIEQQITNLCSKYHPNSKIVPNAN
jgi:ppGpp synthetase/RelA/SpoT-type nucleotidyltranferase/CheY-like chemotaxis protein